MAQINYVSRNQLYYIANLNFGLMCKKAKHCWALSSNFSVQLIFFDHVLLLAELTQKFKLYFKIALWQSDSMKRNFRGFIFTYNTNLHWKIGEMLPRCSGCRSISSRLLLHMVMMSRIRMHWKWWENIGWPCGTASRWIMINVKRWWAIQWTIVGRVIY